MDKNEKEIREMLSPNREKLDSMNCFSHSQYGRFCECEARAVAVLKKEWTEKTSAALTFGKYFHSYFEGAEAFAKFKAENVDEIFTKKGELRAEFKAADAMFKKITGDPKAAEFATGCTKWISTVKSTAFRGVGKSMCWIWNVTGSAISRRLRICTPENGRSFGMRTERSVIARCRSSKRMSITARWRFTGKC